MSPIRSQPPDEEAPDFDGDGFEMNWNPYESLSNHRSMALRGISEEVENLVREAHTRYLSERDGQYAAARYLCTAKNDTYEA